LSVAGAALQLGAGFILGWSAGRRQQEAFDRALTENRPWIESWSRVVLLGAPESVRARSRQHEVYALVHVREEHLFTYQPGPMLGWSGWWASAGWEYSFSFPHIVDSVPQESAQEHPLAETGFGWYTDVREFDLPFKIDPPAMRP